MGTVEISLKCPICQDLFMDPVSLPCAHNFCLTCIRAVWNTDVSEEGPFFCPECQIIFPSRVPLEVNTDLQSQVKDQACNGCNQGSSESNRSRPQACNGTATVSQPSGPPGGSAPPSPPIGCDHCIEAAGSVAVSTCLTCDASLCRAHALLHQQRAALREHTVVGVTGDPMSLKCREHRSELKLFCMQDRVPVCCLCVLVGSHKNHRAVQLQEACSDLKDSAADFRERISDKYGRIRAVLDGDERLMMQIIDAEERYTTEWLETQRVAMETLIQEADGLRAQSRQLLQETNNLTFLQRITAQALGNPLDLPPIQGVDGYLCDPQRMRTAERLVDDLSVALSPHFPRLWSRLCSPSLDVETAHPRLEVSQDRKQVFWRRQPPHETQNALTPYDCMSAVNPSSVLAQEGFTAGRHYWEVIVQDKPYWLIGATTGPASKQDEASLAGVKGDTLSWCIYHGDGKYLSCHDNLEKPLSVPGKTLRKLGVLADLQQGELSFYDADMLALLESYRVEGTEALFPVFNPCINVNGVNRQPLSLFCLGDAGDRNVYADENEG
ncbi:unnamed protein product [Arctogadus glacialis]